jgi:hypothetical protein
LEDASHLSNAAEPSLDHCPNRGGTQCLKLKATRFRANITVEDLFEGMKLEDFFGARAHEGTDPRRHRRVQAGRRMMPRKRLHFSSRCPYSRLFFAVKSKLRAISLWTALFQTERGLGYREVPSGFGYEL